MPPAVPGAVRVLLMGPSVRNRRALEAALGVPATARLQRELYARARRWADAVAPGKVHPGDDDPAATLRERVGELFAAGRGPVLVAWPELAQWRSAHTEGAVGDLSEGCVLSLGPMFDGGFYLVAFARPVDALLALDADAWNGPDPIGLAATAAAGAGLAIGLLRSERGLRTPDDVRAMLADPLLDDELRELLG